MVDRELQKVNLFNALKNIIAVNYFKQKTSQEKFPIEKCVKDL